MGLSGLRKSRADQLKADLDQLGVKSRALTSPLKQLETQATLTGTAIKRDLSGALGVLSPSLAGVGGAVGPLTAGILGLGVVAAGGAGLFALTKRAADAGDEIFDLTQKVNFSAETISALKNAGITAGVEFGAVSVALGLFDKNLEEVKQGNKELGRTFKALKIDTRDNETALRSAFRALADLGDGGQQTALAMKIFGKSGKEILGLIKETNGDIDTAIKKYKDLGLLISTDTAKAANEFSDKLALLEAKFDAVARSIGERFMPTAISAMDQVNAALDRNKATAQSWATDLVAIVEFAATQIKYILEGASQVIEGFRKTFGEGSFVEHVVQSNTYGKIVDLRTRKIIDLNNPEPRMLSDSGEFAIAGGAGQFSVGAGPGGKPIKAARLDLSGGGGGGAKAQKDILQGLRAELTSLNVEYRKFNVELLDSANATALATEKEKLLSGVMTSLKSGVKERISQIRDIDEALETAITNLPKKSQAAARGIVDQSLAQFKLNEQLRIGSELNKRATELSQGWRVEADRARSGADKYTVAIQDLEKAYAKYGLTLEPTTRAELEQIAAMQRALELTLSITRARRLADTTRERFVSREMRDRSPWIDLGGGSTVGGEPATTSRDRIATINEQILRDQIARRGQQMREVAEDLGAIFGDVFDGIGKSWADLWRDMFNIAQSISRQIVQELSTGLLSKALHVPFESRSGGIVGSIINGIFNRQPKAIDLGGGSVVVPGGTGETRPRTVGRELGGPVEAGQLYRVNERGMEYFRPKVSGEVIPLGQHRSSEPFRLAIFDDNRQMEEWRPNRVMKARKQMRKVGKLGFVV
jgi:hypothetical protein